jgi:hypothetical protein|tara:strand:+ start:384 stop:647 length:264 start_codon:yes stop_codon:yes gene_type:complete
MGKKRSRSTQTSSGTHCQKKSSYSKQQRREYNETFMQAINKRSAWASGKNVMLTIPNPNTNETNKPYIRVPAHEQWGDWRGKKAPSK